MSAWLVSKAHIDGLVQGLIVYGIVDYNKADDIGAMLWMENHRSLNARYGDPIPAYIHLDNGNPYKWEALPAAIDPEQLCLAIHCYDYQSCEHSGWIGSEPHRLVTELQDKLHAIHGWKEEYYPDGKKWTISSLDDFKVDETVP